MIKLKKQKITNLVNYQPFLQTIYLKNPKIKLSTILFENPILYRNVKLGLYFIEFYNSENITLPFSMIKINQISTLKKKYKNILLFNYELHRNLVSQFTKIMIKSIPTKKDNLIQGRIIGSNRGNKKIFIIILGFIFKMKSTHLHYSLKPKRNFYFTKYHKRNFYKRRHNAKRLINCYQLRYLNFKINYLNHNHLSRTKISRLEYVQKILAQNRKLLENNKPKFKKKRHQKYFFREKDMLKNS